MAGYPAPTTAFAGRGGGYGGNMVTIDRSNPVLEKTKSVTYNISISDLIFPISTDVSASASEALPQ